MWNVNGAYGVPELRHVGGLRLPLRTRTGLHTHCASAQVSFTTYGCRVMNWGKKICLQFTAGEHELPGDWNARQTKELVNTITTMLLQRGVGTRTTVEKGQFVCRPPASSSLRLECT